MLNRPNQNYGNRIKSCSSFGSGKALLLQIICLFIAGFPFSASFGQIGKCPHPIDTVVVTAQYAPGSVESAVHKVKVIGIEKIESMGAQNLRDVLSNEMNVRLSQDNILGSSMSLQGISGQNVKIMVDGVPVAGRLNGNIDISQINMYNVERIEIIEGPLSVNYGTDALAGTVNIITKKTQARKCSFSNELYYESIGQFNANARVGYMKKKTIMSLSGGRYFFDGWRNSDKPFYINRNPIADSSRYSDWKPKEQYFANLMAARYFQQLKLTFTSDFFTENVINRGYPRKPYLESAFDDYYKTLRLSNSLNLNGQISGDYYINAMAAYTDFKRTKNTFYKDLTTLEQIAASEPGGQDTSIFRNFLSRSSVSTTRTESKINYELGYDINHETAVGIRIKDSKQQIGDYAIFGSAEYKPVKKLLIRPGLRLMYNTGYKAPPVPSINVKYQLFNHLSLRVSYARGFRSPSLKELYFYFVDVNHFIAGNPDLRAEYSHNLNLSTSYTKRFPKFTFKNDNSIFYNRIENMITLAQSSSTQFSYFNLDKHQTLGIQTNMEWSTHSFSINTGALYTGRYNHLAGIPSSNEFTFSPELRCNATYRWEKAKTSLNLFYKYTGALPTFLIGANNQVIKSQIQAYHMADISISRRLIGNHLKLTIGCKNLFNVRSVTGVASGDSHTAVQNAVAIGMGRIYFLKLDIQLDTKE